MQKRKLGNNAPPETLKGMECNEPVKPADIVSLPSGFAGSAAKTKMEVQL